MPEAKSPVKLKAGDLAGALARFTEAFPIAEKLAALYAGNAWARNDLAWVRAQIEALQK